MAVAQGLYEVLRLGGHTEVESVVRHLAKARSSGTPQVVLDATAVRGIFPNGAVPVAAAIQHFRESGTDVKFQTTPSSFADRTRVANPLTASERNLNEPGSRLDTVWAYTEEQAVGLANALLEDLAQTAEFATGVLDAFNWCLFEVLDNVFQHAGSEFGYVMAQLTGNRSHLSVCVADAGIGIHRSFTIGGHHRPASAFDAITLAVQEGVTSTADAGVRGNGLFGLRGVVEQNAGQLRISSGRGSLSVTPSGMTGQNRNSGLVLDAQHHCTVVDFQLDLGKVVDINLVLGSQVWQARLEKIEHEEGYHVIPIRDHARGTGTRAAAEMLRTWLVNYLNEGAPYLVLDFAGVDMVSSSFADETIGKLAERYGPIGFGQRFKLLNMSPTVQGLLDRAIMKRLSL